VPLRRDRFRAAGRHGVLAGYRSVARGTVISLSSFASKPIEEVVAANPQTFFQVYWAGGRDEMARRLAWARLAGAGGLIAALDRSFSHGRDWGSPVIPERMDLRTMVKFATQALTRPRWLLAYAKSRATLHLTVPNMARPGEDPPTFFGAYGEWMQSPLPSWDDVPNSAAPVGGSSGTTGRGRPSTSLLALSGLAARGHGSLWRNRPPRSPQRHETDARDIGGRAVHVGKRGSKRAGDRGIFARPGGPSWRRTTAGIATGLRFRRVREGRLLAGCG
jgi:hypothetical protein